MAPSYSMTADARASGWLEVALGEGMIQPLDESVQPELGAKYRQTAPKTDLP
jgi:hypothetical protein